MAVSPLEGGARERRLAAIVGELRVAAGFQDRAGRGLLPVIGREH